MSVADADADPDQYVRENRDDLVRIIRHGDDQFVRAMALAALVEYGDPADLDRVADELEQAKRLQESDDR